MYRTLLSLLALICFLHSCKTDKAHVKQEVQEIPVDLVVHRFDREFAAASAGELPTLKAKYPYLFPAQYTDSVWIAKMSDTLQRELLSEVDLAFRNFEPIEEELELFFKHAVYYFPGFTVPKVVTVISDVDYANRVILTDSLLLLGLDNYLGEEHRFYGGIDRYIAESLDKEYLVSDVAAAFAKRVVPRPRDRSFLSRMVYYGKELYLKDRMMPMSTDEEKIGYSSEEMEWARANEEQIWRYFIERELLYSTDPKLGPRFLDPAPFSKFRLELDNESPGRLGRYIGWQIVRAFMEKEQLDLQTMLSLPGEQIFKESNYKPKK